MGATMQAVLFPSGLLFAHNSVEAAYIPLYLPGARVIRGFFTCHHHTLDMPTTVGSAAPHHTFALDDSFLVTAIGSPREHECARDLIVVQRSWNCFNWQFPTTPSSHPPTCHASLGNRARPQTPDSAPRSPWQATHRACGGSAPESTHRGRPYQLRKLLHPCKTARGASGFL